MDRDGNIFPPCIADEQAVGRQRSAQGTVVGESPGDSGGSLKSLFQSRVRINESHAVTRIRGCVMSVGKCRIIVCVEEYLPHILPVEMRGGLQPGGDGARHER